MKKLHVIIFSMLLTVNAFGQVDIKKINESLAKVNVQLYASKYEVSNELYTTFLSSLKTVNSADLLAIAQIDTLKWKETFSYNEAYVHYYHAHIAYKNYPVVNVSHEAAKLFCEWLTDEYNADPKRKFKKVLFRLPSEKEWITAAQGGDPTAMYPWKGESLQNKSGQFMSNYKGDLCETKKRIDDRSIESVDITAPVNSYWKNKFGLYNMSGNVAEMINEKGVSKGGSWNESAAQLKIESKYQYNGKAQTFIGFRYFAEIIEK